MGGFSGSRHASVSTSAYQEGGNDGDEPSDPLLHILENEAAHTYIEEKDIDRECLPDWFDEARYKRGAQTFERDIFLFFSCKLSGLLTLLAIPSIVKVLVLTKQSGQPDKAFRRYVDTIRHMLFWYRTDIRDPKSRARESLAVVRKHHLRGAAAARRAGLPGISQLDMILTQFAFFGYAVLRRKQDNFSVSDQDILDFVHVWRTIGFLIGIDERFNICQFDADLSSTTKILEGICSKWLAPALITPPREFDSMSRALLNGSWCMMPVIEYASYLNYTQERAGVPEPLRCETYKASAIMLTFLHFIPNTLDWPILGPIFRMYHNASMNFSLFMSTYYPLLAWYSFPRNSNTRYQRLVPSET
ncbi:uncharacterized protein LOC113211178 [Frankliniella occidentalis]|uniref:Uncharacterized protein LOC113211178 n=1 Tax=Frankliniella occidentalis TaxID=133901 RepID=A0A6J1T110_FRAOC|nr:uncharacterized protein LOC113211178 [Frankliniella occidentalis]